MPIVETVISTQIQALTQQLNGGVVNTEKEKEFADGLATIVANAIRSATVNVVSVSGVTVGAGISGPGTGTLS